MAEKEYIEREALQNKAFGENHPTFYDGQDIADWYEKCINETPAADVSPVRHGHWEATRETNIWGDKVVVLRCSMCNRFKSHGKGITVPYDFCPNCGAKMDGGDS